MGGRGSGDWFRLNKKTTLDDCRCLDINRLVKLGSIKKQGSRAGSWQWTNTKTREVLSSIAYESDTLDSGNMFLRVYYTITNDQQKKDYKIALEATNTQFGGKRLWFLCPITNKRVSKLYIVPNGNGLFVSRFAYNLSYQSQSETLYDRSLRKRNKIGDKIGGSSCEGKPKGMHHKTYAKLLRQCIEAEKQADNFLLGKFKSIKFPPNFSL